MRWDVEWPRIALCDSQFEYFDQIIKKKPTFLGFCPKNTIFCHNFCLQKPLNYPADAQLHVQQPCRAQNSAKPISSKLNIAKNGRKCPKLTDVLIRKRQDLNSR